MSYVKHIFGKDSVEQVQLQDIERVISLLELRSL